MQHHHHVDEFSVTDVRHTLHELWRVLVVRRWYFLFPFCLATSIACLCSLYAPRKYMASTIIKREHDPVFASLKTKSWIQPYEDLRKRVAADIADPRFIEEVLRRSNLPVIIDRTSNDGEFETSDMVRARLAKEISAGLTVKTLEASEHRDILQISLTMREPSRIPDILQLLRESYMEYSRRKSAAVLENVRRFLQNEVTRCADELSALAARILDMEAQYPGISTEKGDPLSAERSALIMERVEAQRRLDDATFRREQLEVRMARAKGTHVNPESGEPPMFEKANPRYAELLTEIKSLEEKIIVCRTRRGMTEAHPEVRSTRALLEERSAELANTPRTVVSAESGGALRANSVSAIDEIERQLSDTTASTNVIVSRMEVIDRRLKEIDGRRQSAVEHRPAYAALLDRHQQLEMDLANWRKEIAPIENVLYLEGQGRSVHFATIQEPTSATKPVSPDSMLVLLICFGLGGAAGVLSVVVVEVCDRSYRTVKQLAASLGVPVIESVDEILPVTVRRRRLIRSLVVMPALAAVLLITVSLASTMAYYSLERPDDYARLAPLGRVLGQ